jgi:hypothetical protein
MKLIIKIIEIISYQGIPPLIYEYVGLQSVGHDPVSQPTFINCRVLIYF